MKLEGLEKFILTLDEKESNIQKLEKICEFLSRENIIFDDGVYKKIFYVKEIENIINYIIREMMGDLTLYNIVDLSNNKLFFTLITKYCEFNKIKIYSDIDEDDFDMIDNTNCYDSLKIYIKELNYRPLELNEEKELGYRILNGDLEARNELITRNLRLVVKVVTNMQHKVPNGISYMDMISYGNEGLIAAVDRYDVRTGFRFASYAIPCIKQKIKSGISNSRVIRIPENVFEIERKYQTLIKLLQDKLMRNVTLNDISLITNISISELSQFKLLLEEPISLNKIINDEDTKENELIDFLSDETEKFYLEIEDKEKKEEIRAMLSILKEREIFVLICIYHRKMTLNKISKVLNISGERVRQIEARALKKLREYVKNNGFNNYMNNPNKALEKVESYLNRYGSSTLVTEKYYKRIGKSKNKIKKQYINLRKISDCLDRVLENFDNVDISVFNEKRYFK